MKKLIGAMTAFTILVGAIVGIETYFDNKNQGPTPDIVFTEAPPTPPIPPEMTVEERYYETDIVTGLPKSVFLGAGAASQPSEYKTTLAESKTSGHSDTTLIVNSITLKDGTTLSADVLGSTIVLGINPGASNAEIVKCTGLTTATKTFTGCTFGYKFDGSNSTQSTNIKTHSAGETLIITNHSLFNIAVYPQLNASSTITGLWTLATSSDAMVSGFGIFLRLGDGSGNITKKCVFVHNGDSNEPRLCFDDSANKWLIYNDGVNSYDISAGGSGLIAGRGTTINGSAIDIATTTLASGGSGLRLESNTLRINTGGGLLIDTDDQTKVATSTPWRFTNSFIVNNSSSTIANLRMDRATSTIALFGNYVPTASFIRGIGTDYATTSISMDTAQLCFSGTNCVTSINQTIATTTNINFVFLGSAETTAWTWSVPGNSIGTTGSVRITLNGSNTVVSGTGNTWRVKYGGSTICTFTNTATEASHPMTCHFANKGVANAQVGLEQFRLPAAGNAIDDGAVASSPAIDSSTAQNLTITVETGNANDTGRVQTVRAEILKSN